MAKSGRSLSNLPFELLLRISDLLDVPSLSKLTMVSRHLHTVFSRPLYRAGLTYLTVGDDPHRGVLAWAAGKGLLGVVQNLVAVDMDILDEDKYLHALYGAVVEGHKDVVQYFFQSCAKRLSMPEAGYHALDMAVVTSNLDVVKYLLHDAGVDLAARVPAEACYTLGIAASYGCLAMVEELLCVHPAAATARDHKNRTPLHYAAERGLPDIVQLLLSYGADVSARDLTSADRTPLFASCYNKWAPGIKFEDCEKVIRLLVAAGSDLSQHDATGEGILHAVAKTYHDYSPSLIRLLVSLGADPNSRTTPSTSSHDHNAEDDEDTDSEDHEDTDSVADLPGASSQPVGLTPLFEATYNGPVVAALLAVGADPNVKGSGGWTALHFAAREGRVEACRLLLEAGANVSACSDGGMTPLHLAVNRSRLDVAQLLLEHGASAIPERDVPGAVRIVRRAGHSSEMVKLMRDARKKSTTRRDPVM